MARITRRPSTGAAPCFCGDWSSYAFTMGKGNGQEERGRRNRHKGLRLTVYPASLRQIFQMTNVLVNSALSFLK